MEILGLDAKVAEAMVSVFGEKIFKYRSYDVTRVNKDEIIVTLNDNVILKCHNFDGSVRVEFGAKMFILEKNNYWRITIE